MYLVSMPVLSDLRQGKPNSEQQCQKGQDDGLQRRHALDLYDGADDER